jgi:hypothetical protein
LPFRLPISIARRMISGTLMLSPFQQPLLYGERVGLWPSAEVPRYCLHAAMRPRFTRTRPK